MFKITLNANGVEITAIFSGLYTLWQKKKFNKRSRKLIPPHQQILSHKCGNKKGVRRQEHEYMGMRGLWSLLNQYRYWYLEFGTGTQQYIFC